MVVEVKNSVKLTLLSFNKTVVFLHDAYWGRKMTFMKRGSVVGVFVWVILSQGRIQGGDRPPKTYTKVTLFNIILNNSENGIRDISPYCRPLFCRSSVVKCTSSFLQ